MTSIIVLVSTVLVVGNNILNGPGTKEGETGREVAITVQKGWSAGEVADELAAKNIVRSTLAFRMYIKYKELDGKLRPGEYVMREGMSNKEATEMLMKGPPEKYVTLTVPEGFTIEQEAEVVAKALKIDKEEFKELAMNGSSVFAPDFPFLSSNKTAALEGYLFPDTYRFKQKATAEDVIRAQLTQFNKVAADLDIASTNRSIHEITTLASLIEREARVSDERPLISAVIHNRLKKEMFLQIDATVQYALPEWKRELTYKDLEVDSAYNTYKHPGLPPGPIGAPGLDCLKAAIKPANVDYLYYVVKDEQGHHFFTKDYNEFLREKEKQPKP